MAAVKKYPDGTKRISLFMPDDLKRAVQRQAKADGCSATEVIHESLRETLDVPAMDPEAEPFG